MTKTAMQIKIEPDENGELRVDHDELAIGAGIQPKNMLALIRKNQLDLEEFGPLAFQTRVVKLPQGGGQNTEIALLNEPHSTYIMTLCKSTIQVKNFNKRLVKAFFEMREHLRNPEMNSDYLQLITNNMRKKEQALITSKAETAIVIKEKGEICSKRGAAAMGKLSWVNDLVQIKDLIKQNSIIYKNAGAMTAGELAKRLSTPLTAYALNKKLIELGFQKHVKLRQNIRMGHFNCVVKRAYTPTDLANDHYIYKLSSFLAGDGKENSDDVKRIFIESVGWLPSIIPVLDEFFDR